MSNLRTAALRALEALEQSEPCHNPLGIIRQEMVSAITDLKAALAEHPVQEPVEGPQDDSFKTFHRALCERFGYRHDEIDWKRDQVSLIEWIAKKTEPVAPVACSNTFSCRCPKHYAAPPQPAAHDIKEQP